MLKDLQCVGIYVHSDHTGMCMVLTDDFLMIRARERASVYK
jgi:hypothetical protein